MYVLYLVNITTQPSSVNGSAYTEVTFICAAEIANIFLWHLNDDYVKFVHNVTVDVETDILGDPPQSILFLWIPGDFGSLNQSRIHCKAVHYEDGGSSNPVNSLEALLLIQGKYKIGDSGLTIYSSSIEVFVRNLSTI